MNVRVEKEGINQQAPVKIGRNYEIDYFDAVDVLMLHEDYLVGRLTAEDKQKGKNENVAGLTDYVMEDFKSTRTPTISFGDVPVFLKKSDTQNYLKRFGLLYCFKDPTKFDFVAGSSRDILIPRGTNVVEIRIPTVHFSPDEGELITPGMITRSLGLMADYIASKRLKCGYVIGLTHPRLGNIARSRWGFSVEIHPFPKEIYQLIDLGLNDKGTDPAEAQSLETFRRQVLVYQTREEFIKRIPPRENILEDRCKLEDLRQPSKAEVLEVVGTTERKSLRWNRTGVSLELSSLNVHSNLSNDQALKNPGVVALVERGYKKGRIRIDEDTTIPFKTEPKTVSVTYKYSPGVRVIPVSEVPEKYLREPGEAQHAIMIPVSSNPDARSIIYFLSPQDKVIDLQNGSQIYP